MVDEITGQLIKDLTDNLERVIVGKREFSQLVIGRGSVDSRIFVEINAILYRARYSQAPVLREDVLRMGIHVDNVIQDLDKAAL